MRIWKLEACQDEERIGCRWGYVIAETEADAVAAGYSTARMPFIWAHRMPKEKTWPGAPGEKIFWSS